MKMKKYMKKIVVLVVAIAVALALVMSLTADLSKVGDEFFDNIGQGEYMSAYGSTAEMFQMVTSYTDFESYLEDYDLVEYASVKWISRSIENGMGHLEGIITTTGGGEIDVMVDLTKEESEWKVYGLQADNE